MILGFLWTSCESDLTRAEFSPGRTVPSKLNQLKTSYVLAQENESKAFDTLRWTRTLTNIPMPTIYNIEIAKSGTNFAKSYIVDNTSGLDTTKIITVKKMNDAINALYASMGDTLKESITTDIDFRIVTDLGEVISPIFSNTVKTKITTYTLAPQAILYIVGDGLVGWGNDKNNIGTDLQVFFADDSDGNLSDYTYTSYFQGNKGLKFPTIAGDWDTAIGYKDGQLVLNGGNDFLTPATSGLYTLSVNPKTLTVSMIPYTNPVTTYNSVGIIGDGAKGWGDNDDELMTQVVPHVWVAKEVSLKSSGSIKFRVDKKWDTNWGAAVDKDLQKLPFAIASSDKNIAIPKNGTYFVAFNDITKHYVIIEVNELPKK